MFLRLRYCSLKAYWSVGSRYYLEMKIGLLRIVGCCCSQDEDYWSELCLSGFCSFFILGFAGASSWISGREEAEICGCSMIFGCYGSSILTCTVVGISTISSSYLCALLNLSLLESTLTSSTLTASLPTSLFSDLISRTTYSSLMADLFFSLDRSLSLFSCSLGVVSSAQWITLFLIYRLGGMP